MNPEVGGSVGIFDAGIGGLPLAAMLRRRAPQHRLVYLGDAARRPYGPRPGAEVARFLGQAEQFFVRAGCDAWVIACNTASVVAAEADVGAIPFVDMVSAVREAVRMAPVGPVGVLATAGTVASGALPRALPEREVFQVATEELLRLAEEGGGDDPVRLRRLARRAMEQITAAGCASAVLACTDFTCILDAMRAAEPGFALIDPVESAADLTLGLLQKPGSPRAGQEDLFCLTGPHPTDGVAFAWDAFGLTLPPVRTVTIDNDLIGVHHHE
ncbi:glutamate racemase [Saccharopolyspora spinosa]|uniref:Glutamate racemase n=1 Tax=Saccharopolyspora spinosa TaxID=60894 RepID=A0A2N3XZU3_SACSN|nr:aspartate/glutamate racemase family protein [Saccharopolyspora spinosa]PKW16169.1 glutamate racemase [Saccharopolyspora spinosa]